MYRNYVLLFIVVVLLTACHKNEVPEQSGHWEIVSDYFPGTMGRYNPVAFGVNDTLIYGLGDYMSYEENLFNDLWCFTNGVWQKIGYFPGMKRTNAILFLLKDQLYVGLGESYALQRDRTCRDLWRYDLKQHTWDSLDFQFPGEKRVGALLFKTGETIYYGAGYNENKILNDMYTFHPTRGWNIAKPEFVDRQAFSTTFVLNGEVYNCFGKNDEGGISAIQKFNVGEKRWETVCRLQSEEEYNSITRVNAKVFVVDGKDGECAYIVGGQPVSKTAAGQFWKCCCYNPRTNRITEMNAPDVETVEAAFTINGEGCIFDGEYIWKFIP